MTPAWGSKTAKGGFKAEKVLAAKFNNWKTDNVAQELLKYMGFNSPSKVVAIALPPRENKIDVLVEITQNGVVSKEGISVKKYNEKVNFNQLDKRWVKAYNVVFNFPQNVTGGLKKFVGKSGFTPTDLKITGVRDNRRFFLDELSPNIANDIVNFFSTNKAQIVDFLFCGASDKPSYIVVVKHTSSNVVYGICNMVDVVKYYSQSPVQQTKRGNLNVGKISMQRKGGDGGRASAQMLQFKINPGEVFDIPGTLTSQ